MALFDDASLVVTPNGYKAGTLYSIKPTSGAGDMTVVRATTATRVNSAGLIESVANNVPRLDYSNGTCPSILVEPQRTNYMPYSQNISLWYSPADGVTLTSNTTDTVSPDGTNNASKIAIVSGNKRSYDVTNSVAGVGTFSAYVKAGTSTSITLFTSSGSINIGYNLSTLAITTSSGTGTITSVGNGWYRITATNTLGASEVLQVLYTGTAGQTIYIWGFQVEASSYVTSYIFTNGAAVTRNADVLTRAGFGNASTSGTLFFDFYAEKIESPNGQYILQLFAGSSIGNASFSDANGLSIIGNGTAIQIFNNGYTQQVQTLTPTAGQRVKLAIRYNGTNVSSAINGTLSNVFADTAVGVKNALRINNGENGTQAFNVVCFFPSYLTDSELASLTTI